MSDIIQDSRSDIFLLVYAVTDLIAWSTESRGNSIPIFCSSAYSAAVRMIPKFSANTHINGGNTIGFTGPILSLDAVVIKAADLIDNSNYYHLAKKLYPKLIKKHEAFIKLSKKLISDSELYRQLKESIED